MSLLPLFVAVATTIMALLFPPGQDDMWYSIGSQGKPLAEGMRALSENIWAHMLFDNSRLANIVSPLFLFLLPKWVFAIVLGACSWAIIVIGKRIVGGGLATMAAVVALMVFAVPWSDFMYTIIFALNYPISSVALLITLLGFLRLAALQAEGRAMKSSHMRLLCIAAFLTGWLHEGASLPSLTGMLLVGLICPGRLLTRRQPWMLAWSMAFGLAFIMLTPSLFLRIQDDYTGSPTSIFPSWEYWAQISVFNCLFYLYLALFAAVMIRRPAERRSPLLWFIVGFGIVNTLIYVAYYHGPRMGWYNQMICGLGCIACLKMLIRRRPGRKAKAIFATAVALAVGVNYVSACVIQADLSREYDEMLAELFKTSDGVIYYDTKEYGLGPDLYKTSSKMWYHSPVESCRAIYYGYSKFVILPTALRDIDSVMAHPLPPAGNFYSLGNKALTKLPPDSLPPALLLGYEGRKPVAMRYRRRTFVNPTDSVSYTLIIPQLTHLNPRLPLTSVALP